MVNEAIKDTGDNWADLNTAYTLEARIFQILFSKLITNLFH
jgi:hypothetical protein